MVVGKLPVPGPTILMIVGQGPIALTVGAGWGCLDIFTILCPLSPLSPSLWETARYRLKYCLKGPLNPKQQQQQIFLDHIPILDNYANSAVPVKKPPNVASDQGQHSLLTEIFIENGLKIKYPPEPPKTRNRIIQMIKMDMFIGHKRVNDRVPGNQNINPSRHDTFSTTLLHSESSKLYSVMCKRVLSTLSEDNYVAEESIIQIHVAGKRLSFLWFIQLDLATRLERVKTLDQYIEPIMTLAKVDD